MIWFSSENRKQKRKEGIKEKKKSEVLWVISYCTSSPLKINMVFVYYLFFLVFFFLIPNFQSFPWTWAFVFISFIDYPVISCFFFFFFFIVYLLCEFFHFRWIRRFRLFGLFISSNNRYRGFRARIVLFGLFLFFIILVIWTFILSNSGKYISVCNSDNQKQPVGIDPLKCE